MFEYKKPTQKQTAIIENFRDMFKHVATVILDVVPSRERSLALTKLEEAAMWANKAVFYE